jgi:hypothetical protein
MLSSVKSNAKSWAQMPMEEVSYSTGSNPLDITSTITLLPSIASWNESFCERNADKQSSGRTKAPDFR